MLPLTHSHVESSQKSFEFLGTMAGDQTFLKGNDNQPTYARLYKSFGGSNDLREKISEIGRQLSGNGYQNIGNEYSSTPPRLLRKTPFLNTPTTMQGGGFFLTVKTFEKSDQKRHLNCFAYALGTFGDKLEKVAKKSMEEINDSVSQSIDSAVDQYFTNVSEPEDGDLAVYSTSKTLFTRGGVKISGTTHAGVYRKSDPNWNSPRGGTIESKWGWILNPYVFQHDPFFAPDFYGDQLKFYRLKTLN